MMRIGRSINVALVFVSFAHTPVDVDVESLSAKSSEKDLKFLSPVEARIIASGD